jgi:alkylated DNA nucleotide flippase Atl1
VVTHHLPERTHQHQASIPARPVGTNDLQKHLLQAEGIVMGTTGKISLERHGWKIEGNEAED